MPFKTMKRETMKKDFLSILVIFLGVCIYGQAVSGADCSGSWRVLSKRDHRMTPCAQLGLDTNQGICQPGKAYETLCDDAKGNRYRTCQGPRACGGLAPPQPPGQVAPCTSWDYKRNKPCPSGYKNPDCRGGCE
jgi:hypothetical protein